MKTKAPPAPSRDWTRMSSFTIASGSRNYVVKPGWPCRVQGQRGEWQVIAIETHTDGRINVEVKQDRNGHSRVFRASEIIYKRPKKGTT